MPFHPEMPPAPPPKGLAAGGYYSGNNKYQYRHSGGSRNPEQHWMPDQVRHDKREYVYLPE
jgi:hypothetical protein